MYYIIFLFNNIVGILVHIFTKIFILFFLKKQVPKLFEIGIVASIYN